jgi:hypothetical protein
VEQERKWEDGIKITASTFSFKWFYDNASIKTQKSGIKSSRTTSENNEYAFKLSNTTLWPKQSKKYA